MSVNTEVWYFIEIKGASSGGHVGGAGGGAASCGDGGGKRKKRRGEGDAGGDGSGSQKKRFCRHMGPDDSSPNCDICKIVSLDYIKF